MSNILTPPLDADTRRIVEVIRQLIPKFGSFTLDADTSTDVSDPNVSPDSNIMLTQTAGSARNPVITSKGEGTFTVAHDAATGTETFDYLVSN